MECVSKRKSTILRVKNICINKMVKFIMEYRGIIKISMDISDNLVGDRIEAACLKIRLSAMNYVAYISFIRKTFRDILEYCSV